MSKQFAEMLHGVANAVGQGLQTAANHSANAAAKANGATAAFQKNQGTFNAGQATIANNIASDRIAQQWGFNSAQAAQANQFSLDMWQKSADFNAEQAEIQRQWLERMDNTKYQRAVSDMSAAGLNPILAVTGGGISTGTGSGSAASISPISGQQASGSVLQGLAASEGMGSGQMEYMGGLLGLLSAGMSGLSSAIKAFAEMGLNTKDMGDVIVQIMTGGGTNTLAENSRGHSQEKADLQDKSIAEKFKQGIEAMTAYKGGTTANEWYKRKGYLK